MPYGYQNPFCWRWQRGMFPPTRGRWWVIWTADAVKMAAADGGVQDLQISLLRGSKTSDSEFSGRAVRQSSTSPCGFILQAG